MAPAGENRLATIALPAKAVFSTIDAGVDHADGDAGAAGLEALLPADHDTPVALVARAAVVAAVSISVRLAEAELAEVAEV